MVTDAHNHLHTLDTPSLDGTGVARCTTCGTSPADWQAVLDLADRNPGVTPAIGLHPWFLTDAPPDWHDTLADLLAAHPRATVGEIGLDKTRRSPHLDRQLPAFTRQLELAADLDRPASIHAVNCHGTLLNTLRATPLPSRGILLHGYAGSREMLPDFLSLAIPVFISLADPDRLRELRGDIPTGRLLFESDASADNGRHPTHTRDLATTFPDLAPATHENFFTLFPDPAG